MKIGLFIPCYVDVVYPEVGVATKTSWSRRRLSFESDLLRTADGKCRL